MARHIAFNGEWPTFFYGQAYLGPVEAYLAAPLFHLFGPTLFALRLELVLFFMLFLLGMYYLTALLHSQKFGIFITFLFSFGSGAIITHHLRAIGAYAETEFFAVAICLAVIWLALTVHRIELPRRTTVSRAWLYGALGLIIGLSIWVDMLILPFVCLGVVFLLLFCRRECFSWAGLCLLAGLIIGLLPLIIYNLHAPAGQNSLDVLINLHDAGKNVKYSLLQKLTGTFGTGLPDGLGYVPGCVLGQAPASGTSNATCMITRFGWSVGYLILWCVAMVMTLVTIWKIWKVRQGNSLFNPAWNFEEHRHLIVACGRLMILIGALGTLYLYASSPVAVTAPGATSRYLICMLLSVPVVLWPLWSGLDTLLTIRKPAHLTWMLAKASLLLLVVVVYIAGTYNIFATSVPTDQATYNQQQQIVNKLQMMHVRYFYTDYWTCNNLIFLSNEKLICGVVNPDLTNGFNRYTPYLQAVQRIDHPVYVFPRGLGQNKELEERLKFKYFSIAYRRLDYNNYIIYLPN
ncbi:hypothetical protein KDW_50240 [Dictyobacter vulcani]|uniref:Glycosyltransferase RgtA/B/C/D-like domain-containing protein n=2 Tax=Dictyobacter vulcani TaxID=2607529 RepID=A0A5J4KUI7_9CHLR|nr:hypothetical protein KDW_50240 [Dictyobacter vulcani]